MLTEAMGQLVEHNIDVNQVKAELECLELSKLRRSLSVESMLEDLEIIENSARAILSIKEDLIGPARQHTAEIVALPKLLQNTIASMGLPAGVAHTTFALDLAPVRADGVQLNRVFTNLIKNALEAMETVENPQLHIQARPANEPDFISVEISDNGIGIPADQLDQIWIAFFTTKGGRGGTGLGLSACSQIINQLGGTITVQSELGKGSTFRVLLPGYFPEPS
jgi:signal transduction histidine kinase